MPPAQAAGARPTEHCRARPQPGLCLPRATTSTSLVLSLPRPVHGRGGGLGSRAAGRQRQTLPASDILIITKFSKKLPTTEKLPDKTDFQRNAFTSQLFFTCTL